MNNVEMKYRAIINGRLWARGLTKAAADAIASENAAHDVRIEFDYGKPWPA